MNAIFPRYVVFRGLWCAAIVLGLVVSAERRALAQQVPDARPAAVAAPPPGAAAYVVPVVSEELKRQASAIGAIIRGGSFAPGQQAQLDVFFQKYFFPNWAQPANYPSLPDQRKALRTYFAQARTPVMHDHLLELSLKYLGVMVEGNFHPAVRYNALLAIGDLNSTEQAGSSQPVPYPDTLAILVKVLKDGPSDALRVGALRGLVRHCSLGIANSQARDTAVIPVLLDLVKARAPKGRSPEGHAWMKTVAIEALAALHVPGVAANPAVGPNGVFDALVRTLADPASPLMVRCAAAKALGNVNPSGPSLSAGQLVVLLRLLVVDVCAAEVKRRQEAPETSVYYREVRQRLNDILVGLNGADDSHKGVGGLATAAPAKPAFDALSAELRKLITALDRRDADDDSMIADLEKAIAAIRPAEVAPAPAAKPAGPATPAPADPVPAAPAAAAPAGAP